MTDVHSELMRVLVETARAHHAATGGPNPHWPDWYAERSVEEINGIIGSDMATTDLSAFLAAADRRYTSEEPALSWPRAYATWLLEDQS